MSEGGIAMSKDKGWTEDKVGSTMEGELSHYMGEYPKGNSMNYHDDGKGFTRVDSSGTRHSYRDSDNSKGHDHWVNGDKVSRK